MKLVNQSIRRMLAVRLGQKADERAARLACDRLAMPDIPEGTNAALMAIRLGRAFGTAPEYWMNLQAIHDLKRARAEMPPEALEIGRFAVA